MKHEQGDGGQTQSQFSAQTGIVTPTLRSLIRAMRPHQWVKNLLIFVPIVVAGNIESNEFRPLALAFILMCLISSCIYLINDAYDVEADRAHEQKRHRPFAARELPLGLGLYGAPIAVAFILLSVAFYSTGLALLLICYAAVSILYSFRLKAMAIYDLVALTFLYIWRMVIGAEVTSTPVSTWFFLFSASAFFSLAVAKRVAEITAARSCFDSNVPGRGYRASDLHFMQAVGIASAFMAVVVFTLFIHLDPTVANRYARVELLWGCAIVFMVWILVLWIKTTRGELHHDPVVYAFRDRASLMLIIALVFLLLLSRHPTI